jgi:hypothetical protein
MLLAETTEEISSAIYCLNVILMTCGQWFGLTDYWDVRYKVLTAAVMSSCVRFEVFTAVTMKNGVFGVVSPGGSC